MSISRWLSNAAEELRVELVMPFLRRCPPLPSAIDISEIKHSLPSISALLRSCKTARQIQHVHAQIVRRGLEQDHFVVTQFIRLSNTLLSLSYSASVLARLFKPSTVLWNSLIKGHCERSGFAETISVFVDMKRVGVVPDKYTFPMVIKACSVAYMVPEGRAVHGSAVKFGVDRDVFVGSSLVDLYGKCGDIVCARKVFDEMSERNVVSWTAMVAGYAGVGDLEEAERLFDQMPHRNVASWNALINGFVKLGDMRSARIMFDEMHNRDVVSFTTMIDGYAKIGDMVSARFLFERSPNLDIVAWSAIISGYVQNGQPNEAVKLFHEMSLRDVKPDEFIVVSLMSACSQMGSLELAKWVDSCITQSSIDPGLAHVVAARIDMNAKCGNIERAMTLFEEMPRRSLVAYCSMIQGMSIHWDGSQAVGLFNEMLKEGLSPDDVAFTVVLAACSRTGLVEEACHYFESMKNDFCIVPSPDHYACMVDLLSRSGQLKQAHNLLKSMPIEPHAGSWGALLGACKLYSDVELGKVVADQLLELEPTSAANYVLLSSIYAAAEQWLDVSVVRNKMEERGIRKICGCSWI